MITYWVDDAGAGLMHRYLGELEPGRSARIRVRTYETLSAAAHLGAGAHIFAALDQLGPHGRALAATLSDELARTAPGTVILNQPRRVLRRYQLLRRMFDAGINTFQARRADEALDGVRFPVFVREESGHNGALTSLLAAPRALSRALRALGARGFRRRDLLVVEFCDMADASGTVRTASAFKVGKDVFPAHLLSGRQWMLKWGESDHGERAMQEHLDYLLSNPHEAWLRRIFEMAGIDFGRIDYGVRGDTLQVWEINTHPTLALSPAPDGGPAAPRLQAMLQRGRAVWRGGLERALATLADGSDEEVAVRLDARMVARARAEMRRAGRRRRMLQVLRRIYGHPTVGRLLRRVYARVVPRT